MGSAIASGARDWRNLLLQEKGIVEPPEHQVAIIPALLGLGCGFLSAFGPPFLHHFG
jgi:hypothetical protein